MSKSREQLVSFLKEIDITDKIVLDAGCGPKEKWARNFTKGRPKSYFTVDSNESFQPDYIADLNEDWIDENTGQHYAPEATQDTKDTYLRLSMILDQPHKYEIIFCLEVLEHCWNPLQAVNNVYRLLEYDKGKAYFSTPFINPYHDEVDYARYTDEWYQKVLTEVGFKDIKIWPRVATYGYQSLMDFYQIEGLRMSKIRLKKGQQGKMAEIGYFVEARK